MPHADSAQLELLPAAPGPVLAISPGTRATGVATIGPAGGLLRFSLVPIAPADEQGLANQLADVVASDRPGLVLLEDTHGRRTPSEASHAAAKVAEAVLDA